MSRGVNKKLVMVEPFREEMVKELLEIASKGDVERLRELFEDPESLYSTDPSQALNKRDAEGKSALDIAAMLAAMNKDVRALKRRFGKPKHTKEHFKKDSNRYFVKTF